MGQGELFAIPEELVQRLLGCTGDGQVMALVEEIEEGWNGDQRLPCWKEWAEIHHCLTGSRSNPRAGPAGLHRCFLGSRHLTDPDGGYMVTLLLPAEVPSLSVALAGLGTDWLRARFIAMFGAGWGQPIPEDYLQSLAELFLDITRFYAKAASEGSGVLFATDEQLRTIYREGAAS
jgi:hypothetical protein